MLGPLSTRTPQEWRGTSLDAGRSSRAQTVLQAGGAEDGISTDTRVEDSQKCTATEQILMVSCGNGANLCLRCSETGSGNKNHNIRRNVVQTPEQTLAMKNHSVRVM